MPHRSPCSRNNFPLRKELLAGLISWYRRHSRDLPWRNTRDPYSIWISEIMLQQTQVETVKPYYKRFLKAFPDVEILAAAPLDQVLKVWEGLGYYARARNLHRAARLISAQNGHFPRTAAGLQKLPGIGRYSAAAIASICFAEPVPVLDGNVIRVLARLTKEERPLEGNGVLRLLGQRARMLMESATELGFDPGDFNQALMELGATVCRPRVAECELCPLAEQCIAHLNLKDVTILPKRAPRPLIPHYDITAAVIHRRGRILITQRPADGLLGGLWEFPGGKLEPGETLAQGLAREIKEELNLEIEVGELLGVVKHAYTHFRITLHAFHCRALRGRIRKLGVADYRWITPDEFDHFPFPKADRVLIGKLKTAAGNSRSSSMPSTS